MNKMEQKFSFPLNFPC